MFNVFQRVYKHAATLSVQNRGTQAKNFTSYENARVTNIVLLLPLCFRADKNVAAATLAQSTKPIPDTIMPRHNEIQKSV